MKKLLRKSTSPKSEKLRIGRSFVGLKRAHVVFIVGFSLIGIGTILISHAATSPNAKISEAESYSSNASTTIINDTSASNGSYVQFDATPTGILTTAQGTIRYVDCNNGNDNNSGTSPGQAWKTLTRANQTTLASGDAIALMSGCSFDGQLIISQSGTSTRPIIVAAYGNGARPKVTGNAWDGVVKLIGSYIIVDGLELHANISSYVPAGSTCAGTASEYVLGYNLVTGATHNTIQNSYATGFYAGIFLESGANNNIITKNTLVDNLSEYPNNPGGNDDAGAFGIALAGDSNDVSYNQVSGNSVCSVDYGADGSAVEVYGGSNNVIHHNTSVNNNVFSELGESHSSNNTFAFNVVRSNLQGSMFLYTRGNGDFFGPVSNTKVYNNTAYLTASDAEGVGCGGDCSTGILSFYNNIIWTGYRAVYSDKRFDENNNVYWRPDGNPLVQFPSGGTMGANSKKANPLFVNPGGGDFHLQSTSPAINGGATLSESLNLSKDFDGKSLTTPLEIGAYQYP